MNYPLGPAPSRDVQRTDVQRACGLHEQTANHLNRLCSANESLRQLLCRTRGSQPEPAEVGGGGKNPETPSITELHGGIQVELCRLEQQVNELASLIG